MQAVGVIVDSQCILLAVKCELAVCYAVAITSDEYAQISLLTLHDVLKAVVAPDHTLHLAVTVRHHHGAQGTCKVCNCYFTASLVLKDVEVNFLTLNCSLEILSFEAGQIVFYKEITHIV